MEAAGFDSPRQEARALVEAVTGLTLAEQLASPEQNFGPDQLARLEEALENRLNHMPFQRIAGRAWFGGLPFQVSGAVLVPRPETEYLLEEAYRSCLTLQEGRIGRTSDREPLSLLDSFTGSGAVGISLGHRLRAEGIPFTLTLVDISPEALEIARTNVEGLLPADGVRLVLADIWPEGDSRFDLVTANPPYVESAAVGGLMPEVAAYDPRLALDGGEDGLDFYRRLADQGRSRLSPGGLMLVEVGAGQAGPVSALFTGRGWKHEKIVKDFAGHKRVLVFSG